MAIFLSLSVRGGSTFYSSFFILLTTKVMMRPLAVPRLYKLKHVLNHLNAKFRSVYTPECDVSVAESLMMWKGRLSWKVYIPSKRARFGTKSFELSEAKSDALNFIIYTGHDAVFDKSLKINHMVQK
jgi:hypothetical protein